MALSADGRHLATAVDNVIAVRESATGTQVLQVTLDYRAEELAFSPFGTVLATVNPRLLQLWDFMLKTEIARMPIDKDWYDDLALWPWMRFLPAARLVSLEYEYRRRFWLWDPVDMIRSACAVVVPNAPTLARVKAFAGEAEDPVTCRA